MGLLPCWVCFIYLFFSLDWVYNLLFRIDVGLFFLGRLALLQIFWVFFFFGLKLEQKNFFIFYFLFEGVPNFF